MKRLILSIVASSSLLASNYKLMHLSSDAVALSSSNLSKSFSADAAIINPANMGFMGNKTQFNATFNYYQINGSTFKNSLKEVNGEPYYIASDAKGKNFGAFMPNMSLVYPINEEHFLGFGVYTDFAAVYGWKTPYAQSLADLMDVRGGSASVSYAYKLNRSVSLGLSLVANHTKLKYSLKKLNVENPRYIGNKRPALASASNQQVALGQYLCSIYKQCVSGISASDINANQELVKHDVYYGNARTNNGLELSYKLALTYSPEYFDDKLKLSAVYHSSYENIFEGDLNFNISNFGMFDFMQSDAFKHASKKAMASKSKAEQIGAAIGGVIIAQDGLLEPNDFITYNGSLKANFLYPASINLGASYELNDKHEFMINIGRTFWSKNKTLDVKTNPKKTPAKLEELTFNVAATCTQDPTKCANDKLADTIKEKLATANLTKEEKTEIKEYLLSVVLNQSLEQGWKDTTLISLGYKYNYSKDLSFMFGFATEDSPVRRDRISFLAKDSRLFMYSFGTNYRFNENLELGLSMAYQKYADVSVHDVNSILLYTSGSFSKQSNQIVNIGVNYKF